jgi:hypothetical protein
MNTSTLIGLKYGGMAAAIWFAAAFVLINLGLRAELVLLLLGFISLPATGILVSRVAYASGKKDRPEVKLHDA